MTAILTTQKQSTRPGPLQRAEQLQLPGLSAEDVVQRDADLPLPPGAARRDRRGAPRRARAHPRGLPGDALARPAGGPRVPLGGDVMSAELSQADLVHLHKAWNGYVQLAGLVVTAAVLADASISPHFLDFQERFAEFTKPARRLPSSGPSPLPRLDGRPRALRRGGAGGLVALVEDGEALRPSFVVRDPETAGPVVLGLSVDPATDLDARAVKGSRTLLSPHQTLERLLWENGASISEIINGRAVRLVYAPRGERTWGTPPSRWTTCSPPRGGRCLARC